MFLDKYLEQDSLTFESYEDAAAVQKILVENGYCTMMSREEHLMRMNGLRSIQSMQRRKINVLRRSYVVG